eukprot:5310006-Pyramimonas_sp.AAC.1
MNSVPRTMMLVMVRHAMLRYDVNNPPRPHPPPLPPPCRPERCLGRDSARPAAAHRAQQLPALRAQQHQLQQHH